MALAVSCTDRIELAAMPSSVAHARHWTADRLAHSEPTHAADLIDAAVLLVSELVTNAVQAVGQAMSPASHLDRARISLLITRIRQSVRIEVHDSACGPLPTPATRTEDDEDGRGLMVIATLSDRWGWRPAPCGKMVWCELSAAG